MFTVIVLVNSIYVNAQQTKIDSLRFVINSTKADTSKIILYETLAQAYRDVDKIDSSILSYKSALLINKKVNYSLQKQSEDIAAIDFLLYTTGNYAESLQYASDNLILTQRLKDTSQFGFSHAVLAHNYKALGEYKKALNHYFAARKIFIEYYHFTPTTENDPYITQCIGEVYLKMNFLDSALIFTRLSLSEQQKDTDPQNKAYSLRILGDIYAARSNYKAALNYYKEFIAGFVQHNKPPFIKYKQNSRDMGFVYNNISEIFEKTGQKDSAIFYAKKALNNANEYHDQQNIYNAAKVLSELYTKKDEYKKAVNQKNKSYSVNTSDNETSRTKIDSLKKMISKTRVDTSKIILYENLAQAYRDEKKIDSSILTYEQALKLNEKNNYSPLKQCYNMGTIDFLLYSTGNYERSLEYASKVLALSKKLNDTLQMAHANLIFGHNYTALGYYKQALNHYFKAKLLFKLYNQPGENDLANEGPAMENIAEVYLKLGNRDSALIYTQQAYAFALKYKSQNLLNYALRIFGDIYLATGNAQLALKYLRQYVDNFYKRNENNRDISHVYLNMGECFKRLGQVDSSIYYTKLALQNAKDYHDEQNIYNASTSLYNFYKDKDNYKTIPDAKKNDESQAFAYFKIAEAAKDSMASIEKIRQIQALTFNEQVREKEQQEADIKQAAKTKRIIIIASILVSIIAFLIWNRVRQLRLKYKSILEQKESEKLKTQLLELEAKALRAQMNPHFIFNCMNSIKLLMQQNENDKAINYLTTFSKLIRTIFQNSDKREITLHDEIETCKLYTQLESMRFADKFSYAFSIDETVDLKLLMVPALIIQPFIENAIWHGIMPKEDGGCVKVIIKRTGENVLCIIDDDGIGRETSKQNKFQTDAHESKGVHLTQSRIDLDNLINQRNASLEIIDKEDKYSMATGTKVILTFKEY